MIDVNNLLTVVLPLKGREQFTLRIMEYLDRSEFPFRLIIADGSKTDTIAKVLSQPENYPNLNYSYKKYSFDANYSDYYRKMVSALLEVKTPYVALLDNDCFPVVDGLSESVSFLELNTEYSACRGQHIDFTLNPFSDGAENLLHGAAISINPVYFDKTHTIWNSFEKNDPLERILDWSHCTNIMHYNVYKTKVLLNAWEFISRNNCCDLFFCEIALALYALSSGKSKVIDIPFILRQQNSPESASKEAIQNMDILDRMFVEKWTVDVNQLINDTASCAGENKNLKKSEAVSKIKLAIKNHFADRLYAYLSRREHDKKNDDIEDIDKAKKRLNSCVDKLITISQPDDAHQSFVGVVEFLMENNSGSLK